MARGISPQIDPKTDKSFIARVHIQGLKKNIRRSEGPPEYYYYYDSESFYYDYDYDYDYTTTTTTTITTTTTTTQLRLGLRL